jgi:N-methylhydantoinase A
LIKDGQPSISNRGKVEGRDVALPMIDINTVSAGGGTLAHVDRFGELIVGPHSAGAVPGPACYMRGGDKPTITDCNAVLGYLSPDNFLGGKMKLDIAASRKAIETAVSVPLAISIDEGAEGLVRIINVKMQEAIKAISTMRGHDLRDFMLLAFGGAGPLHAAQIAQELGMAGVIVPLYPGVYSALGLVMSDVKHDYIRSRMVQLANVSEAQVNAIFADLESEARKDLAQESFTDDQTAFEYGLDMRYAGQGYEMTLPACAPLKAGDLAQLRRDFDEEHRKLFGHTAPDEPVEIVSFRLRGIGRVPPVEFPKFKPRGTSLSEAIREHRPAMFNGQMIDCPVYQRDALDVGASFVGPAIVDQLDCTTVIPPGHHVRIDDYRNMILTMGAV